MKKYRFILLSFSILLVVFAGCSNKVKLGGMVSFTDGEPLTNGTIIFSSDDCLARGEIRSDGTYDVGLLKEKDGLPPGKYKVYITGAFRETGRRMVKNTVISDNPDAPTETEEIVLGPMLAAKYTHRDTTPLEIEVPGENVYNITVERP